MNGNGGDIFLFVFQSRVESQCLKYQYSLQKLAEGQYPNLQALLPCSNLYCQQVVLWNSLQAHLSRELSLWMT